MALYTSKSITAGLQVSRGRLNYWVNSGLISGMFGVGIGYRRCYTEHNLLEVIVLRAISNDRVRVKNIPKLMARLMSRVSKNGSWRGLKSKCVVIVWDHSGEMGATLVDKSGVGEMVCSLLKEVGEKWVNIHIAELVSDEDGERLRQEENGRDVVKQSITDGSKVGA